MSTGFRATMAAALASLGNVPGFIQRAIAEGTIGQGKKVLFIFFRGGNDGINNVIPIQDPAYYAARPNLGIPKETGVDYSAATGLCDVRPNNHPFAIRLGNGFAALHPALNELAGVYNVGELAIIHRVAYPR